MSNNWQRGRKNKSWGNFKKASTHPPHLKGKAIGLFYRDQAAKRNDEKKERREIHMVLNIPSAVMYRVSSDIQAIEQLALKQNITLRKSEMYIKEEPMSDSSFESEIIAINSDDIVKCENDSQDFPISEAGPSSSKESPSEGIFKAPKIPGVKHPPAECSDFIPVKTESTEDYESSLERTLHLRDQSHYKYGYQDIITGTFDEKLDENLAKGINICAKTQENKDLSVAMHEEYKDMVTRNQFKSMMGFREKLPTFKKSVELLNLVNNNQVVVISGETGCGKSTQVPQIILDDAIRKNQGAYIHILVTQPRRIAASSLASRVAQERAESLGNSVGYAVRLEKTEARPRGSIMYVTTGILLADLEVNQGLTNYSHIILDEAHERDCHMDFSMCMLKLVLKKRHDLKLILMSATIDSDRLSAYFDNCPTMHIEGLAYPVQPLYLEDVLALTRYQLPADNKRNSGPSKRGRGGQWKQMKTEKNQMERDVQYRAEISSWLESIKSKIDRNVYVSLQDSRIEDLNIDLIIALLRHISKGPPGAVLVFLPGIGDISKLVKLMNDSGMFPSSMFEIYPLHSKLPTLDQHKIFQRPPQNIRKIIIATNIAETSITIDDIVYVVDCGRIKMTGLNVETNVSTLKTDFESKANLMQRRGRAGRCQPGIAYHLLTSYRAQAIPDRLLPELQRSNLLEPVLQVKKLRLGNAQDAFKLMPGPPAEVTVDKAVRHLQQLGALDGNERLTPLGWHLARLPVHPAAGKLLLFGALFGCVERAAAVAAVWGFKDPFTLVIGKQQEVDDAKRSLALGEPSDHIAISEAIIQWERLDRRGKSEFAYDYFLSYNTLQLLSEMKQQLCENLRQMGFLAASNFRGAWENRNKDNLCVFKAIMAAALYPNIGMVRWTNSRNPCKQQKIRVSTPEDGKIQIHPSSVMSSNFKANVGPLCDKPGANWLVYWLKQKSSALFLFDVTLVYTLPLLFFGELVVTKVEDSPNECYMSVATVKVRCPKETADVLFKLRSLLDQVLASMVTESSERSTRHSQFDELVFKAVIDVMTAEDERSEYMDYESDSGSDSSYHNRRYNHYY